MTTKTIQLSSSGLKNIVLNEKDEYDDFYFVFDQEEIKTNKIHAEFISPTISHLHRIDPTINRYSISSILKQTDGKRTTIRSDATKEIKEVSKVTRKLLDIISRGEQFSIEEEEIIPLKILSIVLGNEELYENIERNNSNKKNSTTEETEEEINTHLKEIMREVEIIEKINKLNNNNIINHSKFIDYISYHITHINIEDLIRMSPTFFYEIIKNEHLGISTEDELYNIIEEFISTKDDDEFYLSEFSKNDFYELIDYSKLSVDKFKEFLDKFNCMNMTEFLWRKLVECFYVYHEWTKEEKKFKNEETSKNYDNCPQGIISKLFEEAKINPAKNGLIEITGNSYSSGEEKLLPNIADSNWKSTHWVSQNVENSHIKIDFKNRLVKVNKYFLRIGNTSGNYTFQNWTLKCITEDNREIVLDEVSSNKEVVENQGEITRTINIDEEPLIKSITLTMKGKMHGSNTYHMKVRNIEFYGSIQK